MDYVARHFDYVLGPTQDTQLANIAAGQRITSVLPIKSQAPFILRSRAWRVKFDASFHQTGLNSILARWYGPDRMYTSQNLVRQSLLTPYGGQIGNPLPLIREVYYPPESEIRVDILNDSASAITNLTWYFRGVELYRPGAVKAYRYPEKFGLLPFVYTPTSDPKGGIPILTVPVTTGRPGPLFTFRCRTDADFVLQGLQGGIPLGPSQTANPLQEVFVTLKDEDEKPYSSAPVHISVLAGSAGQFGIFPSPDTAGLAPVAGGPNAMGLLFPEIYIPKNQVMYFNIQRDDAGYAGADTANIPLQFIGTKVFKK